MHSKITPISRTSAPEIVKWSNLITFHVLQVLQIFQKLIHIYTYTNGNGYIRASHLMKGNIIFEFAMTDYLYHYEYLYASPWVWICINTKITYLCWDLSLTISVKGAPAHAHINYLTPSQTIMTMQRMIFRNIKCIENICILTVFLLKIIAWGIIEYDHRWFRSSLPAEWAIGHYLSRWSICSLAHMYFTSPNGITFTRLLWILTCYRVPLH